MRGKLLAGTIVNALMLAYLALGMSVVLSYSVPVGVLYVVLIALSFILVAYSWCAKCPCRLRSCTHIWLGRLTKVLPQREPGPYTFWDSIGAFVYITGLHLLPQPKLWQNKALFVLFWVLALATFLVGPLYACKLCEHRHCPMNRKEKVSDATTT